MRGRRGAWAVVAAALMAGCGSGGGGATPGEPAVEPAEPPPGEPAAPVQEPPEAPSRPAFTVEVEEVAEGILMHRSYAVLDGTTTSSNGLAVWRGDEVFLVDTPWDDAQTRQLLDSLAGRGGAVVGAVVTHGHDDRGAGVDVLLERGIPVWGSPETAARLEGRGLVGPDRMLPLAPGEDAALFDDYLVVFHPGPGHVPENLLVYQPETQLLYGGCFLRSAASSSLGYTGEAVVDEWAESVERAQRRFPRARTGIPGHGAPGPADELLEHTLELARAAAGGGSADGGAGR